MRTTAVPRTRAWRTRLAPERMALIGLLALSLAITLVHRDYPSITPFSSQLIPLFIASAWLGPRLLPWFVVWLAGNLLVMIVEEESLSRSSVIAAVVVFAIAGMTLRAGIHRTRLGVTGRMGEDMLVDLRSRLERFSAMPPMPPGWAAEVELRPADGASFSGDFVVARRSADGRWFDVAVVDVSGKGVSAGTRSLLLTGAVGALMGAVPGPGFLVAANDYLVDQDWDEGFATAVHVHLDLDTGEYEIRSAGHPPAVRLAAGAGQWHTLEAEGPVLGILPDMTFEPITGRLDRGDVLLLFTDGMVESRTRDIYMGIDRVLGGAEAMLRDDLSDAARRLIETVGREDDDRALVLLRRR